MYRPEQTPVILGAEVPGGHVVRADGDAVEQRDDEENNRGSGTDGRQRSVARIAAHDDGIRRVVRQLQDPRQHQRNGKAKNSGKQRRFPGIPGLFQHVSSHSIRRMPKLRQLKMSIAERSELVNSRGKRGKRHRNGRIGR